MAGKRRRTTQDAGPPRKSSRTSTAPARLGMFPPLQSISTAGLLNIRFELRLHPIGNSLEGYNALLAFMQPAATKAGHIRENHKQITDARDAILSTLEDASDKVTKLFDEMKIIISRSMDPAVGNTRWYQRGDIFDLEPEVFWKIVENNPIRDAPDFAEYLVRVSQARIESNITKGDSEWSDDMVSMLRFAQSAVMNSSHPKAGLITFQLYIKLIGRVLPEMPSGHGECDARDLHRELLRCVASDAQLRPCPSYMDFAAAKRELWESFVDRHALESKDESDPRFEGNGPPRRLRGLHQSHPRLLSKLEWAAYQEIRSRVLLAVGRHLPAELAELAIDKALESEDIPPSSYFTMYD